MVKGVGCIYHIDVTLLGIRMIPITTGVGLLRSVEDQKERGRRRRRRKRKW